MRRGHPHRSPGRQARRLSQLSTPISAMPDASADRTRYLHMLLTDGIHGLNLRNDIYGFY